MAWGAVPICCIALCRVLAHLCRSCSGRACPLCPGTSDINLFCYRERVVDLDTEIAYGALDFRVAEQELDGPKISRAPVIRVAFVLLNEWVPNSLGSSPMPPIHSPTRRAYWRVIIQLSVRRRLVNRNSPDFLPDARR
jgi:hypothetical protein